MSMMEPARSPQSFASTEGVEDCAHFGAEIRPANRVAMLGMAVLAGVAVALLAHGRLPVQATATWLMAGLAFAGGLLSTWSPCGYSSLCLLRPGGSHSRRALMRWTPTFLIHGLGYAAGAVVLGLMLGYAGRLLGFGGVTATAMIGIGAAAVFYGAHQLRLVRAPYPQRRAQVPHDARQRFQVWVVGAIYGLSLGLNYLTYVQTPILYLVTASAVLSGDPLLGLGIFALFNLGRFLPMAVNYLPVSDIAVQKWLAQRQESAALFDGMLLAATGAALLVLVLI